MQVRTLVPSLAGASSGLLFWVWLLPELRDMLFTSTESGYDFIQKPVDDYLFAMFLLLSINYIVMF